jgi:succinate dehydrogenase hydrophobic anchor subunit
MKQRTLSLKERGLNFEMFMWIITRLTALGMYVLLLTAVIGALIMGARTQMNIADVIRWSFMPNSLHVQNALPPEADITLWASTFWQLVASTFLFVAVSHGVHGLVVIADDYIVSPRGRSTVRFFSIIMVIAMLAMGLYVLWTQ